MALILTIFSLIFVAELVGWVGKSVLQNVAWTGYSRLFHSTDVTNQRKLKGEVLAKKKELLQTSAQDQFAKWAKLRRSVDKGLADLDRLNTKINASRASFGVKFNTLLWALTTGVQLVVGWWYRTSAVFFLPPAWLGPLTWWMSLPFAPAGSVSCGVWQMACRRVIKVIERVAKDVIFTESAEPSVEPIGEAGKDGKPSARKTK